MWWPVRRATGNVRRAGDNRRFDARQEEQPITKSLFFLLKHNQHYLPLVEKSIGQKTLFDFAKI